MGTEAPARSNVRLTEQLYQQFGRGEIPAVLARFDPEIEWVSDSRKMAEAF